MRVIKEADSGFDNLFLAKMTKRLGEAVAVEFPGQLAVLPVEAVTKGRHVLLECADLVAGGMQRRALGKGRIPDRRGGVGSGSAPAQGTRLGGGGR